MLFNDGIKNRTATSIGEKAEIQLSEEKANGMDIIAVPDAKGDGWNCTSWCPMQFMYDNRISIPANAKDEGPKTVSGKAVEEFMWVDKIIIVKMDQNNALVDISDPESPVPVTYFEEVTPFGGPEIAKSTVEYQNFKAGQPDESHFNVVNLDSCEMSDDCDQGFKARRMGRRIAKPSTLKELAVQHVKSLPVAERTPAAVATTARAPTDSFKWANDFTAHLSDVMIINQGGVPSPDGKQICCTASFSGQCQVQLTSNVGNLYHDYSHNRSRFENTASGVTFVDDYKTHKSMQVVSNGTHDVCQSYCPIDPDDTLTGGRDSFLDTNATDLGNSTFKGHPAHKWEWKETILKVVVMQKTDFFADTSNADGVVPLAALTELTPFGKHLGDQNTAWTNFKAGTPSATKFDVQGVSSCPEDSNCGQQAWQAHRLGRHQLHSFAKHFEVMKK